MARNRRTKGKPLKEEEKFIDIPEDEQWRIIQQSGVLKQISQESRPANEQVEDEEEGLSPFAEEVFNAIMLIIPMSFMLLLMEILVHFQYGRQPDYLAILRDRMLPSVPIIAVFIFYSSRYKSNIYMQIGFFVLASTVGPRLVWLINRGNWLVVMRQSPPLATAWIYAIVQLKLLPAVMNLIIVLGFGWYKDLKMIP